MNYYNSDGNLLVSKLVGHIVVGLVGLIVLFGSFRIVGAGERGVKLTLGQVSDTVLQEGLNFKWPLVQKIVIVDVKTQTVEFDNKQRTGDHTEYSSLFAASRDLQDVQIAVVVNYHPKPDMVNKIYQQYGSTYALNVVEPIIRDTIKAISATFTAEELVQKRVDFNDKISVALSEKLITKDAVLERVNITNFEFSAAFSKAIEEKATAVQNALTAKNKLEQVKYEAEQRIATAKGEAEAIRIQAQAITQQGGREYVNLKWVEKWNGTLPQTILGDAVPLLNIGQ